MVFGKYTAPTRNSECGFDKIDEIEFEGTIIKNTDNSGFDWGYKGEGPSNLASYILSHFEDNLNMDFMDCDTSNIDETAFLEEVISTQNKDEDLCITTCDILNWINSKKEITIVIK